MVSNGRDRKDSGYAFVILIAAFVSQLLVHGIIYTVGVFYAIFVEIFPESSGAVATISSLNTAFAYGTGPIASLLVNKFGCRIVTFAGGVIGSLGLVLSMYASNVYVLYVTYGITTGIGMGLAYLPTVTILGDYFDKWRPLAIAVSTAGVGIGQFSHPPIIRYFLHLYGWRGSLLMVAGITLNLCVCAVLFKPFNGRATKEKDRNEQERDTKTKQIHQMPKAIDHKKLLLSDGKTESCNDLHITSRTSELSSNKQHHYHSSNSLKIPIRKVEFHDSVESLVFSYRKAKEIVSDNLENVENPKTGGLFNLFVFKIPTFVLICINNIGACFGISVTTVHLAAYASSFGINGDKSAMLFTVMGLSNFIGRIIFGFLAQLKFTRTIIVYICAFITAGVLTLICPLYSGYMWFMGYAATFGFMIGCFGSLLPSIIIDLLDVKYLASAFGYTMIFAAIGTLLGAPAAGWLYDMTGVYSNSFYLAGPVVIVTAAILLIPVFCEKSNCACSKACTLHYSEEDCSAHT